MTGEAADITVPGKTNSEIIQAIKKLGLRFDQVIDEQVKGKAWVHISFRRNGRQQMLSARDGHNGTVVYASVS